MHEDQRSPERNPATTAAGALDVRLRTTPGALVAALGADGMQPVPPSMLLHGQQTYDQGLGIDLIAPRDQLAVLDAWTRSDHEPIVRVDVHLLGAPDELATLHFFDVRAEHGVHILVLDAADPDLVWRSVAAREAQARPAGRVVRDGLAVFIEVDDATTALLGWSADELIGRRTVDLVHPDDAERAIDGWVAMRSGAGTGRLRLRYRHRDGHYVWIEVTNESHLDDPDRPCVVSELVDISDEMAHIEDLRERERNLARLAEALPIGICHLCGEGEVLYANAPFTALLGTVEVGDDLLRRIDAADRQLVSRALRRALLGRPAELEVSVHTGDEALRCELSFRSIPGDSGEADGVIVCAADVTDRSRLRAELEHRANHDALSGCLNRAASVQALERALSRSTRVAVAYVDLDGFKAINDELGHAAGDELLRVAAARLRAAVRSEDHLGRLGGDEFVVICPHGPALVDATDLVTRLRAALDGDVVFDDARIPLRASIGAVTSEPGERDAEAVLVRADAAMYEVKRTAVTAPPLRAVAT